jgi:hypothetical protein
VYGGLKVAQTYYVADDQGELIGTNFNQQAVPDCLLLEVVPDCLLLEAVPDCLLLEAVLDCTLLEAVPYCLLLEPVPDCLLLGKWNIRLPQKSVNIPELRSSK